MKAWSRVVMPLVALLSLSWTLVTPVLGTSMQPQNVVDLISLSESILVGEVVHLTDGFDARNLPYTEVTLRVRDSIRGDGASTYTFRQFGLLQPRQLPDGRTNLQVSPQGWPRFREGEETMVFLYKEAEVTGLRTTVGLFQGKFNIVDGQIANELGNLNLFHNVTVDRSSLSSRELELVNGKGSVVAEDFISFVRKAVDENWIENGRIAHEE